MGMKDTRRQIMLHSDGKLDIELEEQVYTLKEVTISSEKIANVRNTTMGVERLKVKDIKNIPMAFGEVDIMKVVMSLPGVKAVGEASSGFNVRGGATDQNLILFNDGTVYNPTHLFGFFSVFNPDVVKDMELYKSSIPAKYGGRISSVLDINSREGNKKEFKGSASIGLLTSRLTLEGPLFSEKTSFIVGGRTTYSDWILKKLPEKSGYKDGNAGFYDLNATINHKFDERNNLYLSRQNAAPPSAQPGSTRSGFALPSVCFTRCGTAMPTKEIGPANAVTQAASRLDSSTSTTENARTGTPTLAA